jgi:hypothetical protein
VLCYFSIIQYFHFSSSFLSASPVNPYICELKNLKNLCWSNYFGPFNLMIYSVLFCIWSKMDEKCEICFRSSVLAELWVFGEFFLFSLVFSWCQNDGFVDVFALLYLYVSEKFGFW